MLGSWQMEREIEVKLRLDPDTAQVRRRLEAAGAVFEQPRAFEDNVLYDDAAFSLSRRDRLLRLRTTRSEAGAAPAPAKLTYKEPVPEEGGPYKVRGEINLAVDDTEGTDTLLRRLGFRPIYRYQKYRTSFRAGEVKITLDETPIGNFLELEGPREEIDSIAAALGHSRTDYINLSYYELHQQVASSGGGEPGDMLFEGPCGE
jgi:adenylate cyclase class 2